MTNYGQISLTVDLGITPHRAIEAAMHSHSHGVWYWANGLRYVKSRGHWTVRESVADDGRMGKYVNITDAMLEGACKTMAQEYASRFAQLLDGKIDAPLGDLLVQLALFGEEKYG